MAATWSDVPSDVIDLLARRMEIPDLVRFGAVCTSWRSLLDAKDWLGYGPQLEALSVSQFHLPKLMLGESSTDGRSDTRYFFDLASGLTFQLPLPEAAERRVCGSANGWVVTVGEDLDIHLLNPITRQRIRLPSQLSFDDFDDDYRVIFPTRQEQRDLFIHKAIIIGSPCDGAPGCTVAAIIYPQCKPAKVAIARPGLDESWKVLEGGCSIQNLMDIIHHKGLLYGVCYKFWHGLHVWDMSSTTTSSTGDGSRQQEMKTLPILYPCNLPRWWFTGCEFYLVEVFGELMAVGRKCVDTNIPLPDIDASAFIAGAVVYRIEDERWKEVKDLGDCCLLLGNNTSIALFPVPSGLQRNCIYFAPRVVEENWLCRDVPFHFCVYCLDDGTYRPLYPWRSGPTYSPPIWFFLNPNRSMIRS